MTSRALTLLLFILHATLLAGGGESNPDPAGAPVDFHGEIKPLFAVHCYKCHDAETQKSKLRLDVADAALRGGESGQAAIVPGDSAKSELVRRILSHDKDEQMPPKGNRLAKHEVVRIQKWIDEGAKWPLRDSYWAFQPLRRGAEVSLVPSTSTNPIDRFIDSRLAAEGIDPQPAADARTLLRRVYFDLVGMPPSPEEAAAFFADASRDLESAYGVLLDRLLADPRHGERWARHWLDLVRYAESDGYEDDRVRPLAWRYRDYVVRSLNADKPYDRFIQEQLAGDELWPDDPDAWVATGFARLGAWDGMSKEPEKQWQDFLTDATDATGTVFLGVTLGCARCHDHKYDAISQRDYYAIQAFFAGVKRDTRTLNPMGTEPERIAAAYAEEFAELSPLRDERDGLMKTVREALEKEGGPGVKVKEDAVRKRVETEYPDRLSKLEKRIKALERSIRFHEPRAEVVCGSDTRRTIRLLKGGELSRPGETVSAGFITAMLPEDAATSPPDATRAVLANWITSPENPLTARVIVNRVWQHHFGEGLVATPSDFGRNGKRPTHPELIDWLARRFMEDGWSLKKLHRLILTSAVYKRSSTTHPANSLKDPENRLLWRFDRRRLDAETIRDTILAVSGTLNLAMGGPGVYAALPAGINLEFPNNDKELSWGTGTEADNRRRSIYLFQRRTLTFPLMEVFDVAPMNQSCAARAQTTVAPQALALFNGEFTRECAKHFATRIKKEAQDEPAARIVRAFLVAFTREPTEMERAACLAFLDSQRAIRGGDAEAALTDLFHTLLNTSEMIYPD